jgi:hypothetical protein
MAASSIKELCREYVDSNFICGICADVLTNPYQCKSGHAFCLTCINTWLEENSTCPTCHENLKINDLVYCKGIDNLVGRLLVRCRFFGSCNSSSKPPPAKRVKTVNEATSKGCEWQGAMSALDHHVNHDCRFARIVCPNEGCFDQVQRQLMEKHLQICPFRSVICLSCSQPGICKAKMSEHLTTCPQTLMTCPFASHGCNVAALRRCDYDAHQVEAATKHSELIAVELVHFKALLSTELNNLKNGQQSHAKQLTDIKKILSDYKEQNESLNAEIESLKSQLRVGEIRVSWDANIHKMWSSTPMEENSKEFSVYVPGAGEYKLFLQLCIRTEGYVGFYAIIRQGPVFPVTMGIKVACAAHTTQFTLHSMNLDVGLGYPKLISDIQANTIKDENGVIPIIAFIKLRCTTLATV